MLEDVGQEVVEIGLGDGFAEDGGHEAEVGFGVVGDLGPFKRTCNLFLRICGSFTKSS